MWCCSECPQIVDMSKVEEHKKYHAKNRLHMQILKNTPVIRLQDMGNIIQRDCCRCGKAVKLSQFVLHQQQHILDGTNCFPADNQLDEEAAEPFHYQPKSALRTKTGHAKPDGAAGSKNGQRKKLRERSCQNKQMPHLGRRLTRSVALVDKPTDFQVLEDQKRKRNQTKELKFQCLFCQLKFATLQDRYAHEDSPAKCDNQNPTFSSAAMADTDI